MDTIEDEGDDDLIDKFANLKDDDDEEDDDMQKVEVDLEIEYNDDD